jgi:hypothetical protein
VRFAGLRTVAFDGLNSLKVPDTDRNRSWLGKIRHRLGMAGYPALRVMALAETGTRGLLGATAGSVSERDEARLARRLLPLLGPGMLICSTGPSMPPPSSPRSPPPAQRCWPGPSPPASPWSWPTCPTAPTSPGWTAAWPCGSSRPRSS